MFLELISVIIPVYNCEKYIKKCVSSIINQTYTNFEILIINDGSTDNTFNEVKKINDSRIKIFNKKNSGVSDTRNYGLENACGKYIIFIDADDFVDKYLFERMINLMNVENVDMIRFNGFIQDKNGNYSSIEFPKNEKFTLSTISDKKEIIEMLNTSIRCYSPLLFMKNSNLVKFRTNLTYLEDKMFYFENFLNNKKILFIDEKYYYYTYNSKSKTKSMENFIPNISDIITSQEAIKNFLNNEYDNYFNFSTISLIVYRCEYLASITCLKNFKNILKKLFLKNEIINLFDKNIDFNNKYVKFQYSNLRNRSFSKFYLVCFIKNILKKMR